MYTAKIVDIKKDVYQFSGEPFLNVEVAIVNDQGATVETRKYAYFASTTEDEIVADLEHMLETYKADLDQAEKQKEQTELAAKADATIEALTDAEIEMPA